MTTHLRLPVADALRADAFGWVAVASGYPVLMLLALGTHTDALFPWSTTPLTAATLGGAYAGAIALCALAVRAPDWPSLRAVVPSVALVTAGVLVASVLGHDELRLGGGPVVAFVASWIWLAVNGALVLAVARGVTVQLRRCAGAGLTRLWDRPAGRPAMPWPLRVPLLVLGGTLLLTGVGLVVLPGHAGWWPWPLSPLDARVTGVWALALGVGVLAVDHEADLVNSRPGLAAAAVTATVGLVALARYPVAAGPAAVVYATVLVALAGTSIAGLLLAGTAGLRAVDDSRTGDRSG